MIRLNKKSLLLIASFLGAGVLIKNYYLEAALSPTSWQSVKNCAAYIDLLTTAPNVKIISDQTRTDFLTGSLVGGQYSGFQKAVANPTVSLANVKQYILTNFSSEIASLNASTPKIQDVQAVKNKLKLLIQDGLYEGAIAKQAAWPQDLIDLGSFLGVSAPVLQTSMGTAAAKNIGGQNTAAQQMRSTQKTAPAPAAKK